MTCLLRALFLSTPSAVFDRISPAGYACTTASELLALKCSATSAAVGAAYVSGKGIK